MLGPFSAAFLAGEPRAEPFLSSAFRRSETRREHVKRAGERRAHPALLAALRARPLTAAQRDNVEALERPGTVAVVTGQQVALFLGPLYSVYKAATAIVAARALERETGARCVPVFWLQTEDHDFEEIDHCHVLDAESNVVKLKLPKPPEPRTSVKHALLHDAQLDALAACLGSRPHAAEVIALFRAHYRPEASLADAFAGVMGALFANEGLLFVDPRDPALARAAAPVHARAIRDAGPLSQALAERSRALTAAGFEVQVAVRDGSPLSFFHPEAPTGPRYRLTPQGDGFAFVGRDGEISREALLNAVELTPERFSTSALLRPMLQDTLLPVAAYSGGPGELNYFAQLAPLYEAFGLPMPMLLPRARFRIVEPRTKSLLEQLKIEAREVEVPAAQLLARVRPPPKVSPEAVERAVVGAAERALAEVPALDASVNDAVKLTRGTIARAASRLAGRYRRSLDTTDSVLVDRVRRVQEALYPHQEPQERVLGLPPFAARIGVAAFAQAVLDNIDPWSPQVKELTL